MPRLTSIFVITVLLFAGCSRTSVSDVSAEQQAFTSAVRGVASHQPHELFVFVATGMPADKYQAIEAGLESIFLGSAEATPIHVIATPEHETVCSFTAPRGGPRVRKRNREFVRAVRRTKEFLSRASIHAPSDTSAAQLDVPQFSHTVERLRRSRAHGIILAFGDPVYCPHGTHPWAMTGGLVPSDAALKSAECSPFGPSSRQEFSADDEILFVAPCSTWGDSFEHRKAVERFYALYFSEIGGRFAGILADPEIAFIRSIEESASPLKIENPSSDPFVGMWSIARAERRVADWPATVSEVRVKELTRPIVAAATGPALPESLERRLQELPPDRIGISIRWEGESGLADNTDLDLYIKDKSHPSEEICFRRMRTEWGELFRDVRQSLWQPGSDFSQWEYAEIKDGDLANLDIWIDVYHALRPIKCIVLVACRGRVRETQIDFNVTSGDHASEIARRATSSAWRKISLVDLFQH